MFALFKLLKTLDIVINDIENNKKESNENKNINPIPLSQRGLTNETKKENIINFSENNDKIEEIIESEEIMNIDNKLFNVKTKTTIKNNTRKTNIEKYQLTR